jgi:hypothetical protein
MLHKESAIAVMVAVMLGAASIFGPLSITQATAAVLLTSETITQDSTESMIVDAVEADVKKSTSRVHGTLIVSIVQGDDTLSSGTMSLVDVKQRFVPVEIDVRDVNVTGSFDILLEFDGSGGSVEVNGNGLEVIEGTTVAEDPEGSEEPEPNDPPAEEPTQPAEDIDNVVANQTFTQDDGESMVVDTVEFDAKKSTSRAYGILTVAIVQEDILATDTFSASEIKQRYNFMEASFDSLNVTGDFEVVFMYDGSGMVSVNSISVPGATEPAEEPEDPDDPTPTGKVMLTVNAIDQAGSAVNGMWIEVYSGASASGEPLIEGDTPHTFELDAGQYIVAMADFESNIFQGWQDSDQDRTREATLTTDETFTAVYSTDGSAPPEEEPNPPPSSGPGSIVVFAHRIPNENWGPTFTSANAEMWYVLYNATGWIVQSGFYDEEGTTITGLNDGETYYVYATDCDECHGDPHDVVFDHWEDSTTANPRAVATGDSAHAHYRYDPDP